MLTEGCGDKQTPTNTVGCGEVVTCRVQDGWCIQLPELENFRSWRYEVLRRGIQADHAQEHGIVHNTHFRQ